MTQLDILGVVFGFLFAFSVLLGGASFTRVDREKYPILKKLDGKKIPLFISTLVFLIFTAGTQIIQVTTKPSLEQTQGPSGQLFKKATLTGFEKELEEALSEQRSQTTDYFKAAEHDFATGLYRAAVKNYQKSISVIPTMSAYLNCGLSLVYISAFAQAENAFVSGLQVARKKRAKELEATFLGNIGIVLRYEGKIEQALEYHLNALDIFREMENSLEEANSLMNIGIIFRQQNKLQEALKFHEKTLTIFKEIDNPLGQANALTNIGVAYRHRDEVEEALKYYQKALVIYKKIGNRLGRANAFANIGAVYNAQGKLKDALKSYEEALTIFKEIDNPLGQAKTFDSIGHVYHNQGRPQEALRLLMEARDIYLKVGATGELQHVEQHIEQLKLF